MSVQSDVEILFVKMLEEYSKKYNLTEVETMNIFRKYQVYEKIILQYEYLHQLDFSETVKYVDEVIQNQGTDIVVYHGTNMLFEEVDLSKSNNRRDFGRGFYCTILYEQAREWAKRLHMRNLQGGKYVYHYVFRQADNLKIKRFESLDKEWLEFIKTNRAKGGIQHTYDVVIGPVADDNTMETIQLYIAGILSADEAVERLRYNKINNQVSFHTEKALKCLHFENREEV